jgi:hypothetical protein
VYGVHLAAGYGVPYEGGKAHGGGGGGSNDAECATINHARQTKPHYCRVCGDEHRLES